MQNRRRTESDISQQIQFAYGYLRQEMIEIILWMKPKEC